VFGYTLDAHLGPSLISSFAFVKGMSESNRLAFAPECEPAQSAIHLPEFWPAMGRKVFAARHRIRRLSRDEAESLRAQLDF